MSPEPILRARRLSREYDGYLALDSLEVDVAAGEFVALVGPNGAGKTSFLNLASGLLEPTSGEVEIAGAAAGSIEARRAVSFLPDTPVFYEDLSIGEHLGYVAALHGVADPAPELTRCWSASAWTPGPMAWRPNSATGCARRRRSRLPSFARFRSSSPTSHSMRSIHLAAKSSLSYSRRRVPAVPP